MRLETRRVIFFIECWELPIAFRLRRTCSLKNEATFTNVTYALFDRRGVLPKDLQMRTSRCDKNIALVFVAGKIPLVLSWLVVTRRLNFLCTYYKGYVSVPKNPVARRMT